MPLGFLPFTSDVSCHVLSGQKSPVLTICMLRFSTKSFSPWKCLWTCIVMRMWSMPQRVPAGYVISKITAWNASFVRDHSFLVEKEVSVLWRKQRMMQTKTGTRIAVWQMEVKVVCLIYSQIEEMRESSMWPNVILVCAAGNSLAKECIHYTLLQKKCIHFFIPPLYTISFTKNHFFIALEITSCMSDTVTIWVMHLSCVFSFSFNAVWRLTSGVRTSIKLSKKLV